MSRHTLLSRISLVLACVIGTMRGPLKAQDDGLNWLGDYREALRLAKQTNKPIFLEFRCEA